MKTIYVLSFLMLIAITIQSCSPAESSKAIPSANAPIPVKVIAIKQEEVSQPVIASGQFTTDDETKLSFKTGGVVNRIFVKEGDVIKKGQLLATLDLTEIKAQVTQAELSYEKAQRDFTRAENLYKDSVATLEQFQNAQTALSIAVQQVQAAKFNLNFSEIRAVADGYVLNKYVNAGQVVASGTPILRTNGAGKSHWIFKTGVSDKEWSCIQIHDSSTIKTDFSQEQHLSAKVIRKAESADPVTGAFYIELLVENQKSSALASGLFGRAIIYPRKKEKVWNIPHEALLDGNSNKGFVFVTSNNTTARKVPVTIAAINNEYIRISAGLDDSTSLIIQGSAYLSDNSFITVVE